MISNKEEKEWEKMLEGNFFVEELPLIENTF